MGTMLGAMAGVVAWSAWIFWPLWHEYREVRILASATLAQSWDYHLAAQRVVSIRGGTLAIPLLVDQLRDPESQKCVRAAAALGDIAGARNEAVPELVDALAKRDPWVRRAVVGALRRERRLSLPLVLKRLSSEDANLRAGAAEAAGAMRATEALPSLLLMMRDEDPQVRSAAASAATAVSSKTTDVLPALMEQLADENDWVWGHAADLIGGIGPDASPRLLDALRNPNPRVRAGAVQALNSQIVGAVDPISVATVCALLQAISDDDAQVRLWAVRALVLLGERNSLVPIALAVAQDRDSPYRRLAVGTLGEMGPEAEHAVPALVEMLRTDDYDLKCDIIRAIGKIHMRPNLCVPELMKLLNDRRVVQAHALEALARFGSDAKNASPAIMPLLNEKDIKPFAVHALDVIDPEAASAWRDSFIKRRR